MWCGMVCSRCCGEGPSPKSDQQLIMSPQDHHQSWKGSVLCCGVWCVWWIVVSALLVMLSSMRCLSCEEKKNDMSRQ